MSNSMTPETDAMMETDAHRIEEYSAPLTAYRRMCDLARALERDSQEWRKKAVDLHKQLAAERALADRLAKDLNDLWRHHSLTGAAYEVIEAAITAWKEERR